MTGIAHDRLSSQIQNRLVKQSAACHGVTFECHWQLFHCDNHLQHIITHTTC